MGNDAHSKKGPTHLFQETGGWGLFYDRIFLILIVLPTRAALFFCRTSARATCPSRMQPTTRRNGPPGADRSHTCGLRSVFSEAHVLGKNGIGLASRLRARTLRGFWTDGRKFRVAFPERWVYNVSNLFLSEERHMAHRSLTTASFLFSYGWARFMGTGFFGMEQ